MCIVHMPQFAGLNIGTHIVLLLMFVCYAPNDELCFGYRIKA